VFPDRLLDEYTFDINYARHFLKNQLAIGFYVPLKIREQHIRLTNALDPVLYQTQLNNEKIITIAHPELLFSQIYGNNIEEFFTDILE
jgi:hypothetical protein